MNVREALGQAWPEMDIKLNVYVEHGQQVSDFPVHTLTEALAPIIEKALRAAHKKGWNDREEQSRFRVQKTVPNTDNGVTAGVATMMEGS